MIIAITGKKFYRLTCFCKIFLAHGVVHIIPVTVYFFEDSKTLYDIPISVMKILFSFKICIGCSYRKSSYLRIFISGSGQYILLIIKFRIIKDHYILITMIRLYSREHCFIIGGKILKSVSVSESAIQ